MEVTDQSNDESTKSKPSNSIPGEKSKKTPVINRSHVCIACGKNDRAVAFIPCAHFITCLSCGHGMTECPMCRSKIRAIVRIYG